MMRSAVHRLLRRGRCHRMTTGRALSSSSPQSSRALSSQSSSSSQPPPRQNSDAENTKLFMKALTLKGQGALSRSASKITRQHAQSVHANADTNLAHIDMYGFDYDYTLASYNDNVQRLIYDEARKFLVGPGNYPADMLMSFEYDKNFAIRGLHFDKRTGYLMKMDQFCKIQLDSVFMGRTRQPARTVADTYNGSRLSTSYINQNLHMFTDLFCLPWMCLLSDVIQAFLDNSRVFTPEYVSNDVARAIDHVHRHVLHDTIASNPETYLNPNPYLASYLTKMRESGKKAFLLTNSPFKFVDAGMRFLLRDHMGSENVKNWPEVFDVVVCNAKKPYFYDTTRSTQSFRRFDTRTGSESWEPVTKLRRGEVYVEGGLEEFTRLTKSEGGRVLYMGDQIYADLVAPQKLAKWKTAAIIKEIDHESQCMRTPEFRESLAACLEIESLIEFGQDVRNTRVQQIVNELKLERNTMRTFLKESINENFGSVFRTSNSRSMFFYNVGRYADIYCSSIKDIIPYPLDHCFYVRRQFFPHEVSLPPPESLIDHAEQLLMRADRS